MDGADIDSSPSAGGSSSLATVVGTSVGQLAALETLGEQVRGYLDAARSANTHRAYRADWQHFAGWCRDHGLTGLPADPSTLALYLTAHAEALKASTLQRRLVAIA